MKDTTLRAVGLFLYNAVLAYGIWYFQNPWMLFGILLTLVISESAR